MCVCVYMCVCVCVCVCVCECVRAHLELGPQHEVHPVQVLVQDWHARPTRRVAVRVVDADHQQQADHVPVALRGHHQHVVRGDD